MLRPSNSRAGFEFYYMVLESDSTKPLFTKVDDYVQFEASAARALEQHSIVTHAFCWQPASIHLIVRSDLRSLAPLVKSAFERHARSFRSKATAPSLAVGRHCTQLVNEAHLLRIVRNVHRLPFGESIEQLPRDFPWTSHRTYLQATPLPWLATEFVLSQFSSDRGVALLRYESFMQHREYRNADELGESDLDSDTPQGEWPTCIPAEHLPIAVKSSSRRSSAAGTQRRTGLAH